MRRKIGTIIVLNTKLGEVYLSEKYKGQTVLTTSISSAKSFRATKKVMDTICAQAKVEFAPFEAKVSTIEQWRED